MVIKGIKKRIPVIYPSEAADAAAQIKQSLRQRRLSCVYMGQQPDANMFLSFLIIRLFAHKKSSCENIHFSISQEEVIVEMPQRNKMVDLYVLK